MTVKEFFTGFFYLPARAFSGLTNLFLGSYKRDEEGNIKKASTAESNTNPGILGYILNAVMYVARAASNFIYNHQTAISAAFWASSILAGAAALTVFLWPAALTAIVTFPVFGLTIAGVVGAEVAAQIGAIAALTFAATSVATYAIAGVVNTINWLISCCKPSAPTNPEQNPDQEPTLDEVAPENGNGSAATLSKLGKKVITETPEQLVEAKNNLKGGAPLFQPKDEPKVEPKVEPTATTCKVA